MQPFHFNISSVEDVNKLDLVEYLATIGLHPVSIKGQQYRFFSPFRPETFPTFVVFRDTNTWREGKDLRNQTAYQFGVKFHDCTIVELFATFNRALSNQLEVSDVSRLASPRAIDPGSIIAKLPLRSAELGTFLKDLRIPWEIARLHCIQINLEGHGRIEKTLAFPNTAGGYHLRNKSIDACIGPASTSFKDHKSANCAVFANFADFLSYQAAIQNQPTNLTNFLILNSLKQTHKAHSIMEAHDEVRLYLPRDTASCAVVHDLCLLSDKYKDCSELYQNHQNLNDWIRHIGQSSNEQVKDIVRLRKSG
jgi:hypothetical protein